MKIDNKREPLFCRIYTASEALDILLEREDEITHATITLLPPGDGHNSDEDSGAENGENFNNLPRRQMVSQADLDLNFGSRDESTLDDQLTREEVTTTLRRSARLTDDTPLNLSCDLWLQEEDHTSSSDTPIVSQNSSKWLSGLTPPAPPTAWQKRDIVSKEFVNAPQSMVNCHNVTPYSIFELFFDDTVVEFLVDMTNLYARRDKGLTDFVTDVCEMRLFLCIILISGYNTRPRARMYWDHGPDAHCEAIANAMTRNRFETILKCLHLSDNLNLTPNDKMTKVRSFYN